MILLTIVSIAANAQVAAKSDPIVLTKVSRIGHNNEITIVSDGKKCSLIFKLTKVAQGKLIDMNYYEIPGDGQILLKLDNDSIVELNRTQGVKESRKYENTPIMSYVYTYSSVYDMYDIADITPLLQHAITKVRVELTNKEVKDFEITKAKEQKRILKEFNEQYQIMKSRLETQENRDDDLKYGF